MQYSIQLTKRRMEIGLSKAKCQGRSPQVSGKPSTTDSEEALVGKWSFFVTDFDVTKVQCIQVHLCNTSGTNAVGWEGRRRYNKTVKSSKAFYIAPYAWTWLGLYRVGGATYERRLLLIIFWKAAFVWVTPYLVQLTFSLEACSWKNGDLVFQRWSFFSILETCMGIDDPYVKKPRWRRNWNAISKMIKDGLAEGMVTRKLCVEVLDLVLTSFQTSFFSGHHE